MSYKYGDRCAYPRCRTIRGSVHPLIAELPSWRQACGPARRNDQPLLRTRAMQWPSTASKVGIEWFSGQELFDFKREFLIAIGLEGDELDAELDRRASFFCLKHLKPGQYSSHGDKHLVRHGIRSISPDHDEHCAKLSASLEVKCTRTNPVARSIMTNGSAREKAI